MTSTHFNLINLLNLNTIQTFFIGFILICLVYIYINYRSKLINFFKFIPFKFSHSKSIKLNGFDPNILDLLIIGLVIWLASSFWGTSGVNPADLLEKVDPSISLIENSDTTISDKSSLGKETLDKSNIPEKGGEVKLKSTKP